MREVHRRQFQIGQVPIEKIWINPKSRDDIPAVLKGLQHIWSDEKLRARLFALLDEHIVPETDRTVGRPGMELWQVLVLGVLKQGLGCDFDRLHDLANHHETIRAFLGHSDFGDRTRYEYQRVVDNVSLLTPELLSAVGQLVVESGHKVAKKKPGEPLRGRCDSFVVETDVHYPTDVSLLWDAMRCLLRETGRASGEHAVGGWRQWRYLTREVRSLFHRVRSTRRAKRHPERVEAYLARCRGLVVVDDWPRRVVEMVAGQEPAAVSAPPAPDEALGDGAEREQPFVLRLRRYGSTAPKSRSKIVGSASRVGRGCSNSAPCRRADEAIFVMLASFLGDRRGTNAAARGCRTSSTPRSRARPRTRRRFVEIHRLVLQRPPQPLDENVVQAASPTVH